MPLGSRGLILVTPYAPNLLASAIPKLQAVVPSPSRVEQIVMSTAYESPLTDATHARMKSALLWVSAVAACVPHAISCSR